MIFEATIYHYQTFGVIIYIMPTLRSNCILTQKKYDYCVFIWKYKTYLPYIIQKEFVQGVLYENCCNVCPYNLWKFKIIAFVDVITEHCIISL